MPMRTAGSLGISPYFTWRLTSRISVAEDDATMATDEMNERLERVETKLTHVETRLSHVETKLTHVETTLGQLSTRVDALPTKDDMTAFAKDVKDQMTAFAKDIKDQMGIMVTDCKDSVQKAAEGYGATLTKIEDELRDLNEKVDTKFSDHVKILANHHERISALEGHSVRPLT